MKHRQQPQYCLRGTGSAIAVFVALAASVSALLHAGTTALAQQVGFTVSPVKSFIRLEPGGEERGAMVITNQSDTPVALEARVEHVGTSDEQGSIAFGPSQGIASRENADAWITLDPPFLALDARETRSVPYHVVTPQDAAFGTYSFALIVQTKLPPPQKNVSNATLLPAVASLFFIDLVPKNGEAFSATGTLTVEDFSIAPQDLRRFEPFGASVRGAADRLFSFKYIEQNPVTFGITIFNASPFASRPRGNVVITNLFGTSVGTADIPDMVVLPRVTRAFNVPVQRTASLLSMPFLPSTLKNTFLPGRYTAALSMESNAFGASQPMLATMTFWAFPRKLILSTVILILIAFFIVLYRKRFLSAIKVISWQKP